jgi:hypothetical protein
MNDENGLPCCHGRKQAQPPLAALSDETASDGLKK